MPRLLVASLILLTLSDKMLQLLLLLILQYTATSNKYNRNSNKGTGNENKKTANNTEQNKIDFWSSTFFHFELDYCNVDFIIQFKTAIFK